MLFTRIYIWNSLHGTLHSFMFVINTETETKTVKEYDVSSQKNRHVL
jgi:hypothetical protein